MSLRDLPPRSASSIEERMDRLGRAFLTGVFGDRIGIALFLLAMVYFSLFWRVELFINDNYTIANTLVAVADGHLHITEYVYGPNTGAPGLHEAGDRIYGRNYGQVFLALPVLWFLSTVALVADISLVLVSAWCLGLVALAVIAARMFRRERLVHVGLFVAWVAFLVNVWLAEPFSHALLPVIALQLVAMVAAALTAVTAYRLIAMLYDRRTGSVAGLLLLLASPVAFWATLPKRHSLSALFVVLAMFWFLRSRTADSITWSTRYRAVAYVWVGILAWIHAAEALVLFLALVSVDLITARSNHPRHLVVPGVALLASLAPFFLTNELISGSLITPPRFLPTYEGPVDMIAAGGDAGATPDVAQSKTLEGESAGSAATGGSTATSGAATGGSTGSPSEEGAFLQSVLGTFAEVSNPVLTATSGMMNALGVYGGYFKHSADIWTAAPDRVVETVVRGGYVGPFQPFRDRAHDLTILESMPVFAMLLGLPIAAVRRVRTDGFGGRSRISPRLATDLLVAVYAILLVHLYLSRLPNHTMYTVRYLHPLYPIGVYALIRFAPVRELIETRPKSLLRSYVGSLLVGIPLYIGGLSLFAVTVSESVQLYAISALVVAGCAGVWSVTESNTGVDSRYGAVIVGVAAAFFTIYLIVSSWTFFAFTDQYALPVSRLLAENLKFVNPVRSLL